MIGRISRRAALVIVALLVFATPAFASLIIQNFMQADITVADACFVKVGGDDPVTYTGTDADDPLVIFSNDPATDLILVDGADLLEERLSIRGMLGDRVIYTDVVRYQNNCDIPLDVTLVTDAPTATGDWIDRSARIYISSTPGIIGGAEPVLGRPGSAGSGWDPTPIIVEADTAAIPVTNARTGTVVIAPGEEVRGAIVVSAGVGSSTNPVNIGTVNWVAEAVNNN